MSARNKWIIERKFKPEETVPPVKQASQSSGSIRALAFVNVDNPEQVKDQATQRKIRRHVMKTIGQSRRKYPTRPIKRCPDAAAATARRQIPRPLPLPAPSHWGEVRICPNFKRLFRSMNMVSKGLLSVTVDDTSRKSGGRMYSGFYNLKRGNEHDQAQSMYEIKQYTDSLGLVRRSIHTMECPANRHIIIGTVVCLAYFDVRVRNNEGWTVHMRGLENIVNFYGGVEALESHQALRQSLFLTDVLGSLVRDARPRFPQLHCPSTPIHATTRSYGQKPLASPERFGTSLPDDTSSIVIDNAIQSASRLAVLLNDMPQHPAHQMALELLIPVCKIAHDILSLPRLNHGSLVGGRHGAISRMTPVSAAAELVRLSALALVSTVITTTSGDYLYCAVYRRGLERDLLAYTKAEGWAGRERLKLWVLVIQVMMETEPARACFLDEIMDTMDSLSLQSWKELVSCLHQVAWIAHAAMQEMTHLKTDIEVRMAHKANV